MTSIITGDIINSRNNDVNQWLPILKTIFNTIGSTPKVWEIYRGDSFQIEIKAEDALKICILIKASIKCITNLDVRMAIGIGVKNYNAAQITEANGEVFINSGFAFDNALKKQTLAIKSPINELNEELNISFALALLIMDNWSVTSAEFVKTNLNNLNMTQKELGNILNVSQAGISKTSKRAGFDEIMRLEKRYKKLIKQIN